MNYTPLEDAYRIHHVSPNTYGGTIFYSPICIFCNHASSQSLMNDGGAFRRCDRCKKEFRANIINSPINNFNNSTSHLKGTN